MASRTQLVGQIEEPGRRPQTVKLTVLDRPVAIPGQQTLRGGVAGLVNNTTLTDIYDPWPLQPETWYAVEGCLFCREAGNGLQWKFTVSQTPQDGYLYYMFEDESGTGTGSDVSNNIQSTVQITTTTNDEWFVLNIKGAFLTNATLDSSINFQVSQVTSGAGATNVQGGSWVRITPQTSQDQL